MSELPITINLNTYYDRLVLKLDTHIASLRTTLRSIEDGTYGNKANTPRPAAVVKFEVIPKPEDAAIEASQNAFVHVVRSFVDFMDAMIAFLELEWKAIE